MTFLLSSFAIEAVGTARHTALVLHGVLGSSQNFRGFAKKLGQLRPDYRFVLADLRHHGKSHSAPPPDTLRACADDVETLIDELQRDTSVPPVDVLIGHSFGGKVALEALARQETEGSVSVPKQVWVLDSTPGPQPDGASGEIGRVIDAVRAISMPLENRADVVSGLKSQGLSAGLASWMTTNLERTESGYRWVFDLERIEVLLEDYFQRDLWPYLEQRDFRSADLRMVVAERSERFDATSRQHLADLEKAGRLHYHLIPDAGHWLHVDNPGALLTLLESELP